MMKYASQSMIHGLNPLETAVLLEKYTILLGMINFGTWEQKEQAKKELERLDGYVHNHIHSTAFEYANKRLGLSEKDLEFIEKAIR